MLDIISPNTNFSAAQFTKKTEKIIKDILNDLYRSEISVKSYRLTKNDKYLTEFYLSAKSINQRIEHLQEYADEGGDTLNFAVESISSLILQEYEILEALLQVKDEYRVKVALDKAMETVDRNITNFEKTIPPPVVDTVQKKDEKEEEKTKEQKKARPAGRKRAGRDRRTSAQRILGRGAWRSLRTPPRPARCRSWRG